MVIAPFPFSPGISASSRANLSGSRRGNGMGTPGVMDGHCPEPDVRPPGLANARPHSDLFFDTTSCVRSRNPAGAVRQRRLGSLTVHVELKTVFSSLLWGIRSLNKQVGLAVNPPTAIEKVKPFLDKVDLVLVMTVNPGFGGQSFIEECVPKIQQVYEWRREMGLNFRIEVDGGMNMATAAECARVGADTFVAGSALFGERSLTRAVKKMHKVVSRVNNGFNK
ncbi:MAG: ribulose-phosphate 3-epimerase [Verrucomicrobiota bacterium]|nr:MAG: ribulose-phosphate 3-epimerase [Verrucomicrobiota bacterium]